MGPRLFSRGNIDEAADQRARAAGCFNGAATLQSRKLGVRSYELESAVALQWGRDSSVAEMGRAAVRLQAT